MSASKLNIILFFVLLPVLSFADEKISIKTFQDTNAFYEIQFKYDDSSFSRPMTNPVGCPHYDAIITVFKIVDGKRVIVNKPFQGVFTDGKCYEDNNLKEVVEKAKRKELK